MNNNDFNSAAQSGLAQAREVSRNTLNLAQQATEAQLSLVQDNTQALFGLWGSALDVRDQDGAKALWTQATRVMRENFERSVAVAQDMFASQTRAAQDLGRQVKDQVEQAAKGHTNGNGNTNGKR